MVHTLINIPRKLGGKLSAEFLRSKDVNGDTALHMAIEIGSAPIVQILLNADLELSEIGNHANIPPLYMAIMLSNLDVVKKLTSFRNTFLIGPKGRSPLHAAVLQDDSEIIQDLLMCDSNLTAIDDEDGCSPLYYAASIGNLQGVRILMRKDPSLFFRPNNNGELPVHVAAKNGRVDVIGELLQRDSNILRDKKGQTVLHSAIESGCKPLFYVLYKHPIFKKIVNSKNVEGNTALHIAVLNSNFLFVRKLVAVNCVQLNISNKNGFRPLDIATMKAASRGSIFNFTADYNIVRCLAWTGALPSPCLVDRNGFNKQIEDKDSEWYRTVAPNVIIFSVLVATVTFTAIFTIPGGYIDGGSIQVGTPVLYSRYGFRVFVVSDTIAFILSILSVAFNIYCGCVTGQTRLQSSLFYVAVVMMILAAKAMVFAFCTSVFVMLSHVNSMMSLLIGALTFCALILTNLFLGDLLLVCTPVVIRLGLKGLFGAPGLIAKERVFLLVGNNFFKDVIMKVLGICFFYVVIFVLALI